MLNVYVYVLDTLADWELGYVTAELNSGRFFKEDAQELRLKTVSSSKEPITTMGGLTVLPDCATDDIVVSGSSMLILPGADTWSDPRQALIIEKAGELLSVGATVCAICGATVALADKGILDKRRHTSNGPGFLEMVSSGYGGQEWYRDEPSVADDNLITAGSTGALMWAKQIIERVDVFQQDTLDAWYQYFSTGKPEYFYALMQSLPLSNES